MIKYIDDVYGKYVIIDDKDEIYALRGDFPRGNWEQSFPAYFKFCSSNDTWKRIDKETLITDINDAINNGNNRITKLKKFLDSIE
jgi:hypothetical protein